MSNSFIRAATFNKIRGAQRGVTSVHVEKCLQVIYIKYINIYTEMNDRITKKNSHLFSISPILSRPAIIAVLCTYCFTSAILYIENLILHLSQNGKSGNDKRR